MHKTLNILVIGRSGSALAPVLAAMQGKPLLSVHTQVVGNGSASPLQSISANTDALLLAIDEEWHNYFRGMVASLPVVRPPFFVVGPAADMDLLRSAMRAGARDVFSMPLNVEDLVAAVSRVADEERARGGAPSAHLAAFMNTKGGSGASFLAANTALAAARREHRTILVDLDFQFGGLPTYLNMAVRNGLIKALELADGLDEASIDGYAQKHESGLHLLAAAMDEIILPDDVSRERIERLLGVLDQVYGDVIVDLPRRIDVPTATVLSRAEKVVLVAQQTVAHLHDTRRLAFLLRDQLGLPADRILLVLNRFDKKAEVRERDFANLLPGIAVETIPGDYRRVAESINLGVPVAQGGTGSPLGKRLLELTDLVTSHTAMRTPTGGVRRGWLPWPTRR